MFKWKPMDVGCSMCFLDVYAGKAILKAAAGARVETSWFGTWDAKSRNPDEHTLQSVLFAIESKYFPLNMAIILPVVRLSASETIFKQTHFAKCVHPCLGLSVSLAWDFSTVPTYFKCRGTFDVFPQFRGSIRERTS